jgi:peptidyl-prolyl cis-trans isomerase SurA
MKYITAILGLNFCITQTSFALPERLDGIAAVVNDSVVTEKEVSNETQFILKQYQGAYAMPPINVVRQQVLDKLILDTIQTQQAELTGIQVDDLALDDMIGNIATENGKSINELREALSAEGMNFEQYRESIRKQMIISQLQRRDLENDINVSDQEIDQYMQSVEGLDALGTEYHLAHILISLSENPSSDEVERAQKKANTVIEQLKQGAEFNQLAATLSTGELALRGGDLGWRKIPELPTLFTSAVPLMKANDVQGPFRSASGYHIIKLLDKRHAQVNSEKLAETKVRHILIKVEDQQSEDQVVARLKQIRHDIQQGQDFGALAKTFSADLGSKSQGGDLGWVTSDTLVPEFQAVMATLKKNEISQPFKSPFGWHIAQVQDRRQADPETLFRKKSKQLIRKRKIEEKREAWLRQIREEAYVQITHPNQA